ncbi:hypothetical protein I317_00591 [Kwoniella heveanensis CBS 569]|nr:hypothetical protein I317_00591 [Kwoniella heveanensis CBS 569]
MSTSPQQGFSQPQAGPSSSAAPSSKRSPEEMQKIFEAFEDYKFTEDPVFNDGLPTVFEAIRGKKMSAGMIDKTIAEAQWFYWTKVNNLPIPFSEYEKHLADPLLPPPNPAGPPPPVPGTGSDRGADLSEAFRMMELGGTAGQTHLTFANLRQLVIDGKADHLMGKDIPNRTTDTPPSKSTMQARPKPWREQRSQAQSTQPTTNPTTSSSIASSSAQLQPQGQPQYQAQYQSQQGTSPIAPFATQTPDQASISALFAQPPDLGLFTGVEQFHFEGQPSLSAYPVQDQAHGGGQGQAQHSAFDAQYQSFFPLNQDLSAYMQTPVFPPELYQASDVPGPTVSYPTTTGSAASSSTLLPEMPLSPSYYSPYTTEQPPRPSQQADPSVPAPSLSSSGYGAAQAGIAYGGRGGGQEALGVGVGGQVGMELDEDWVNPAWFSQLSSDTGGTAEETSGEDGGDPATSSRSGPAEVTDTTERNPLNSDRCPPQ